MCVAKFSHADTFFVFVWHANNLSVSWKTDFIHCTVGEKMKPIWCNYITKLTKDNEMKWIGIAIPQNTTRKKKNVACDNEIKCCYCCWHKETIKSHLQLLIVVTQQATSSTSECFDIFPVITLFHSRCWVSFVIFIQHILFIELFRHMYLREKCRERHTE